MLKHYKLVRDLIPDRIEQDGMVPTIKYLERDTEFEEALCFKLVEEAMELRDADEFSIPGELCDVYEVLKSLAQLNGYSMESLAAMAAEKAEQVGTFNRRIKLLSIDQRKK